MLEANLRRLPFSLFSKSSCVIAGRMEQRFRSHFTVDGEVKRNDSGLNRRSG